MEEQKDFEEISVAICDDSALMRNLVSRIVGENPNFKIVCKAVNGKMLLDMLPSCKPDVIVLDIEMPVMTGVEFLKNRKAQKIDVPVIILSSIATQGAAVTIQCLELGASDFITKPGGAASPEVVNVGDELIEKIASYGSAYARKKGKNVPSVDYFLHSLKLKAAEKFVAKQKGEQVVSSSIDQILPIFKKAEPKEPVKIEALREPGRIKVIAIGISTGGPNALRDVFKMIDPHLKQPILVVQHMPAGFTTEFAASLDKICPLTVVEAKDGMLIQDKHVYIAPGNNHIYIEEKGLSHIIRTSQDEPRNGHRPSADVLFESVAKVYKNNALGVIMTGMGRDGAVQLAQMRKEGAWTIGQDEQSSVVYGMPKVAWEQGGVQKQVPLLQIADEISALARENL